MVSVIIAYLVALVISDIEDDIRRHGSAAAGFAYTRLSFIGIMDHFAISSAGINRKKKNFFKFLFQRLPQVLVTTFLGLGGIFPVSMFLVNRTITMSQLVPLSPWIVLHLADNYCCRQPDWWNFCFFL